MIAGFLSLFNKRFFAKFSFASENHSDPKKSFPFFKTFVEFLSALIEE
jgi:hypothetical protein